MNPNTMSTAKHTPGPWFVPTPSQDAFGDYVIQSGSNGGYGVIATTNPKGIEHPEANARLIAAAPDLLAACKAAYEVIHQDALTDPADKSPEYNPMIKLAAQLRNAITQAEGEL